VGAEDIADPSAPGGARTVRLRVCIANACDEDGGLLHEMRMNLPPERRLPWRDRASRDWAVRQLERGPYPGMSEDEQRAAIEWVKATPFFE
jgi:hypothetical protein